MDAKAQMMADEDERHAEVVDLIGQLSDDLILEPGINADGWSVKDLLWHLAAWNAESARELERIRMGTYTDKDRNTDAMNAAFMAAGQEQDLPTVRAEWLATRNRALKEWEALSDPPPEAQEWFFESGAEHMDDHLPELRDWVARHA